MDISPISKKEKQKVPINIVSLINQSTISGVLKKAGEFVAGSYRRLKGRDDDLPAFSVSLITVPLADDSFQKEKDR